MFMRGFFRICGTVLGGAVTAVLHFRVMWGPKQSPILRPYIPGFILVWCIQTDLKPIFVSLSGFYMIVGCSMSPSTL